MMVKNKDGRPVNMYHHVYKRGEGEEDEVVDYTMYMVSILFNRRTILCISYYLLKFDQRMTCMCCTVSKILLAVMQQT